MANMLQSSQTQATNAPGYYTDYLSNLANKGQAAAGQAQFVGAQPLQTQAFCKVATNFGAQQPTFQTGQGYVGQAAGQDVTGAASPYLTAGTTASPLNALDPYAKSAMSTTGYEAANPLITQGASQTGLTSANPYLQKAATSGGLSAADPYLQKATNTSPADLASQYMNPFINTAVQSLSDIGQRNIRQNIAPASTAAAVGSGQFGSQRGAQVLGQLKSQAEQDLNSQISQLLSQGYGQALCAAGKQNALTAQAGSTAGTLAQQQAGVLANVGSTAGSLTNQTAQNQINAGTNLGNLQQGANQITAGLGSTASQAQTAQNQANLTAAQTAAQAAANEGQLLNTAGANMGSLGTQAANTNLACINALSTLGGQQQTIGQNKENFPLTNLASLSNLLQGYSIPTSTSTTLCMSPLSGLAAVGTGLGGLLQTNKCGQNLLCSITGSKTFGGVADKAFSGLTSIFNKPSAPPENSQCESSEPNGGSWQQDEENNWVWVPNNARGGLIQSRAIGGSIGCATSQMSGGMPCMNDGIRCVAGTICTPYCTANVLPNRIMGCASTQYRGGLPTTRG